MSRKLFAILFIFSTFLAFSIGLNQVLADDEGEGQGSGDNFPVDKAGIAAYVKLDVPADQMYKVLTDALSYYSNKETPETNQYYVIGVMKIEDKVQIGSPNQNKVWFEYPHLYIGLDGWMVAYYLKDEEPSRIMQWEGYTPGSITTTTLKEAIDEMCQDLGVNYSGEPKYYDFAYPQATKMTLVAETAPGGKNAGSNSFSVTIPGTLYQASYMTFMHCGYSSCTMKLDIDGNTVVSKYSSSANSDSFLEYGDYPLDLLTPNVPHLINFQAGLWGGQEATVFIYGD